MSERKKYIQKTINRIDQSQLESKANCINIRALSADLPHNSFTINASGYPAHPSKVEPQTLGLAETKRFSIDHTGKLKKNLKQDKD